MATPEQTPAHVQNLATRQARLDRIALIGIFGAATAPQALVRLPDGETKTVEVGSRIRGGTVTAIGDDRLVLTRSGTQEIMRMPQG